MDVNGWVCADFGCNVGGFTDCLLQRGAAKVYALDTGYGALAWKLRNDSRVVVMERTNALHAATPQPGVDLVVIDMAWTPQRLALPAALKWLTASGRIITLVKPHYELDDGQKRELLHDGRLDPAEAERVLQHVLKQMPAWGAEVLNHTRSPLAGGKSSRRGHHGNAEYLVAVRPSG
jgi:23S rRNA (cytidine1920-2'-O)/16S rRNA (cytidine1409-2'-O)-methyltransferase